MNFDLKIGDKIYAPELNYLSACDNNFNELTYEVIKDPKTIVKNYTTKNYSTNKITNFNNNWKEFIIVDIKFIKSYEVRSMGMVQEHNIITCSPIKDLSIYIKFIQEEHYSHDTKENTKGGSHSGSIDKLKKL